MARFVLVHGGFTGGWCWEPVIGPLEAAGHTVGAPDLPGAGEDYTPVEAVTLSLYADRICTELARNAEPAILVGHDIAGMVITQAAARCGVSIALLVYLAAYLPRDGQSVLDFAGLPDAAGDHVHANLTIEGDPAVGSLSDRELAQAFFNGATNRQLQWALERTRAQPLAPLVAPVELLGHSVAPSGRVYIRCLRDHAIPAALQEHMLAEQSCAEVHELDTDHAPFLSRGPELARLLDAIAERLQRGTLGQF
jgi:pimeloyl-ACP methyl ester carboxylesterase